MASLRTAFAAQTAAASATIQVSANNPLTLIGWGFDAGGTDFVDVMVRYDATNYTDCYENGAQIRLGKTNNTVTIYGPAEFKVDKGITTGQVGVSYWMEP